MIRLVGLLILFVFSESPTHCQNFAQQINSLDRTFKLDIGFSASSNFPKNRNDLFIDHSLNPSLTANLSSSVSTKLLLQFSAKYEFSKIRFSNLIEIPSALKVDNQVNYNLLFLGLRSAYFVRKRLLYFAGASIVSSSSVFSFFDFFDNRNEEFKLVKTLYIFGEREVIPYLSTGVRFLIPKNKYFKSYIELGFLYNVFRIPLLEVIEEDFIRNESAILNYYGNNISLGFGLFL